jgi:hypothetical protein
MTEVGGREAKESLKLVIEVAQVVESRMPACDLFDVFSGLEQRTQSRSEEASRSPSCELKAGLLLDQPAQMRRLC